MTIPEEPLRRRRDRGVPTGAGASGRHSRFRYRPDTGADGAAQARDGDGAAANVQHPDHHRDRSINQWEASTTPGAARFAAADAAARVPGASVVPNAAAAGSADAAVAGGVAQSRPFEVTPDAREWPRVRRSSYVGPLDERAYESWSDRGYRESRGGGADTGYVGVGSIGVDSVGAGSVGAGSVGDAGQVLGALDASAYPPELNLPDISRLNLSRSELVTPVVDASVAEPAATIGDKLSRISYPSVQEAYPSVQEVYPSVQEVYPSVQEVYPSVQEAYPSVQETYPSVQETYPSVQETYQVSRTDYPSAPDTGISIRPTPMSIVPPPVPDALPPTTSAPAYAPAVPILPPAPSMFAETALPDVSSYADTLMTPVAEFGPTYVSSLSPATDALPGYTHTPSNPVVDPTPVVVSAEPTPIATSSWSFLPAPEPVAAPESVASVSLTDPASPVSFTAPSEVKPVGHWTSQLDGTVSENTAEVVVAPVSTTEAIPVEPIALTSVPTPTPTTANDLILPSLHDTGGVVRSAEGGMLLTDSISLPSSLGIMGAQPSQIDSPEVDRSLDRVEDIGTDFRPVTAAHAISRKGTSSGVVTTTSKDKANLLLVLGLSVGFLALAVFATLIIGAVTNLL
ncbi:MAG: hypothetical protein B5766_11350 [Candidatus Lumbricidophila eiseniae]|uniref:Uncharacterized protein n=1 Tax=Candidatus Lumbricidiphila eiseniae TaxID=1969409 RepID=A0A2A6FP66_9MICO|nr:MAG: hypothetical protein B5766_11350 [Candidatus Lumbricidophila eiseniae]